MPGVVAHGIAGRVDTGTPRSDIGSFLADLFTAMKIDPHYHFDLYSNIYLADHNPTQAKAPNRYPSCAT
jgi:hypothetical protein